MDPSRFEVLLRSVMRAFPDLTADFTPSVAGRPGVASVAFRRSIHLEHDTVKLSVKRYFLMNMHGGQDNEMVYRAIRERAESARKSLYQVGKTIAENVVPGAESRPGL